MQRQNLPAAQQHATLSDRIRKVGLRRQTDVALARGDIFSLKALRELQSHHNVNTYAWRCVKCHHHCLLVY